MLNNVFILSCLILKANKSVCPAALGLFSEQQQPCLVKPELPPVRETAASSLTGFTTTLPVRTFKIKASLAGRALLCVIVVILLPNTQMKGDFGVLINLNVTYFSLKLCSSVAVQIVLLEWQWDIL